MAMLFPEDTEYPVNAAQDAALIDTFSTHTQDGDQQRRSQLMRELGHAMSRAALVRCPPGYQRALALTKIEEAVMWAVKAISLETKETK